MDTIAKAINISQKELPGVKVLLDEPMSKHTTFRIGGTVRAIFFPETTTDTVLLSELLYKQGVEPYIIGNGSNLLVSDAGLNIVVINTSKLRNITLTDTVSIYAESGVLLSELAVFAWKHGLAGLEFAHGIPGTLGGAVVMNAGAYDGEMKDVIVSTKAYNNTTGEYTLDKKEHEFSYRSSIFTYQKDIILSSVINLKKENKDTIKQKMDELASRRSLSQPLDKYSAGSAFKRPKEGYAAQLIEKAGLKGFTKGGAQVSDKHAGFIINKGNATFSDVMSVIEYIQETVLKQSDVLLEPEVKILNEKER